jgi:hypothetical protein
MRVVSGRDEREVCERQMVGLTFCETLHFTKARHEGKAQRLFPSCLRLLPPLSSLTSPE